MNVSIQDIMRLPTDLRGIAYLEATKYNHIRNLRGLARHILDRENKPTAFVSLNEERGDDADYSLHERIAAADPADLLSARQILDTKFDATTEATLDVALAGTRAIACKMGFGQRRAQQKVKHLIDEYAGKTQQVPLFIPEIVDGEVA